MLVFSADVMIFMEWIIAMKGMVCVFVIFSNYISIKYGIIRSFTMNYLFIFILFLFHFIYLFILLLWSIENQWNSWNDQGLVESVLWSVYVPLTAKMFLGWKRILGFFLVDFPSSCVLVLSVSQKQLIAFYCPLWSKILGDWSDT